MGRTTLKSIADEIVSPMVRTATVSLAQVCRRDKDIYDMSPEELKNVPSMPGSLDESLQALEDDCDFLLPNDVFNEPLVERWIDYKRGYENDPAGMRPIEFSMYFDA